MQPAPRRVRAIYTVIASPNRLEILRILNTRGPLSYSELKTLAGFKSKKESGKFAYHLRKLVKQMLVFPDRSERKYSVTNLGRLVLNLTRQIEEQAMVESGKLYVRTSRQAMEEFNPDKIYQSLVREAGMPVDLAQKMTSAVEARLHKFQTTYLTGPLIREIVNSTLVEHGLDEYRHKLTRIGMPVSDVNELFDSIESKGGSLSTLMRETAKSLFREYLLLAQLPRDVSDAHLAGDIHISNAGYWAIYPDTIAADLLQIQESGLDLGHRSSLLPKDLIPANKDNFDHALSCLSSLMLQEASSEACLTNLVPFLAQVTEGLDGQELERRLAKMLLRVSTSVSLEDGKGCLSLHLGLSAKDRARESEVRDALLRAYQRYLELIPLPSIALIVPSYPEPLELERIASIASQGGRVALDWAKQVHTYTGIVLGKGIYGSFASLHSLHLNLPRLAYESNRDETYFRGKLAILLQLATTALSERRKLITQILQRGLLPFTRFLLGSSTADQMGMIVGLTGLREAISVILGGEGEPKKVGELAEKTLDSATKVLSERSEKLNLSMKIGLLPNGGGDRLSLLDKERYGRLIPSEVKQGGYLDVPVLSLSELVLPETLNLLSKLKDKLEGAYSVLVRVEQQEDLAPVLANSLEETGFLRLERELKTCRRCGSRVLQDIRCPECKSLSLMSIPLMH